MTPQIADIIGDAAGEAAGEQIPSRGALLEQRHQLLDPAVPPLGGAQPVKSAGKPLTAREFFAALADGYRLPVTPWAESTGGGES